MAPTRRAILTAGGAALAAAAVAPRAFAQWRMNDRYPDPAVQHPRSELRQVPAGACQRRAALPRARAGTRARCGSATAATSCGATSPTTASCAGRRRRARSACSASPPTTPTATPATARAGSSPASTTRAGSRAPNTTARSPCIMDKFDGKPLNSPNDVVVKSDDSIWFTDPPFGILGNYEGHVATPELPTNVYRFDPKTGRATVAAGDVNRPNGLAFSPDESKLYIVEAAANPRVIKVFDVTDNGTKLANGRVFLTAEPGGTPDGFRLDVDGNLWCGWGMGNDKQDGVKVFDPDRQADRLHRAARALRQRLLRRRQAQPPVHGGEPRGLFALRQHAGREGRVTSRRRSVAALKRPARSCRSGRWRACAPALPPPCRGGRCGRSAASACRFRHGPTGRRAWRARSRALLPESACGR